MKKVLDRSKRCLVLASIIAVITIVFYFDSNMNLLQPQQYFRNENDFNSYSVKSEFQAMMQIVKNRNDLCSSMIKRNKNECTRSCSKIVMNETLQRQKMNFSQNNNNFLLFAELLPDFPCFPLSGCRCPAPECILEKRRDTFAEKFRQNRKMMTENRNQFRLKFQYDENMKKKTRNASTIYQQFASIEERKFLELHSEKFEAIHDDYLCVQNSFYEQPKTKDVDENDDAVDELRCRNPNRDNDNNEDPLPENEEIQKAKINETVNNNNNQNLELLAMKNVNRFKRRTSWGFSRWYDWKINSNNSFQFVFPQGEAVSNNTNNSTSNETTRTSRKRTFTWQHNPDMQPDIVAPDGSKIKINERNSKDENSRIVGGYDVNGIYRLENVCITPEGKPFGYFGPKDEMDHKFRPFQNSALGLNAVNPVKPFHGSSEVGRLASKINNVVQDWISHIPSEQNQQNPVVEMMVVSSDQKSKNASSSKIKSQKKKSPLDGDLLSMLNFGQLPFPPPFFVDGKFMLMGVDWKSDNPGHALYRFLAARNIAKKVWGMSSSSSSNDTKEPKNPPSGDDIEQELAQEYLKNNKSKYDNSSKYDEDFHVIYLLESKSDVGEKTLAGYKYFYDLLGSSWSTILNRPAESSRARSQFFSSKFLKKLKFSPQISQEQKSEMYHQEFLESDGDHDDGDEVDDENYSNGTEKHHQNFIKSFFQSSMVCFKEIVVAHTCGTASCSLEKQFPGNGYHVPYVQTMSSSQKIFLRYFRLVFINRCSTKEKNLQNYQKSTSSTIKTKVTLLVRKTSRIDLGLASAIPAISTRLKSLSNYSSSFQLRIVSQQDLTPKQFLSIIHHETDILIGSMGASLSYLWLLKTSDDDHFDHDKNVSLLLSSPFPSPSSSVIVEISGLRSCAFVPYDKKYPPAEILPNINNNDTTLFFHNPKKSQGWNLHPHCDFGAMSQAVGIQHLAISLPKFSTKGIWTGKREKNIDLVDAEEKFIFDIGGNNSRMEKLFQKKKLLDIASAATDILDELNNANSTNSAQTQYNHLFTEEMSVLYKINQAVLIPSIMISSSSTREPNNEHPDEKKLANSTVAPAPTTLANHKVQLWFDNKPRRRRVSSSSRNRLSQPVMDHSKDKVKSSTYPLGFKTPVTYVGTDLYLQILDSCLCRHLEIQAMMLWRKTMSSEMENILDGKCPWRPKEVRYVKLKWGVDS